MNKHFFFLLLLSYSFFCSLAQTPPLTKYTELKGVIHPDATNHTYAKNLIEWNQIIPTGAAKVKLVFTSIGDVGSNSNDYICVYDGPDDCWPLIGTYSVQNLPPDTIYSSGYCLSIYFITDDVDGWEAGWTAQYYGIRPIPTIYTDRSGIFTDGVQDPMQYQHKAFAYLIKPTEGPRVKLSFPELSFPSPNEISLYVYAGENETAPLIASYSYEYGYDALPSIITSNGNSIYIMYLLDFPSISPHWTAQYSVLTQDPPINVTYTYDLSGNRTNRNIIILKSGSTPALTKHRQVIDPEEYKKIQEERIGSQTLKIYPNPTSGQLKVEVTGFDFSQKSSISVYSPLGNLIIQKSPATSSDVIDLSSYTNGLYLMRIILGDKVSDWKILKE